MADVKTKKGAPDSNLISLKEEYEVAYWTKKLGVTREQLEELVKKYGHSAKEIRKHLKAA